MTTRRILAEAAERLAEKGIPCGHCNSNHSNRDGTCGCDTCIQGGGVCGECGGQRYFAPLQHITMEDFGPEKPVCLARRPKPKELALGRRMKKH